MRVSLGAGPPAETYLSIPRLLEAARAAGADAVHPGYGFLSENAGFARAVAGAGLVWVGPPPVRDGRDGRQAALARAKMEAAGVPVVPGSRPGHRGRRRPGGRGDAHRLPAAHQGVGRRRRQGDVARRAAPKTCRRRWRRAGASPRPRSGTERSTSSGCSTAPATWSSRSSATRPGNAVHLFERECSVQRRHQKIVEETPSAALGDALREAMGAAAVAAARAVGYVGAGTVEFLVDRAGALLLSRDEHAPAGRARDHGGDARLRPRARPARGGAGRRAAGRRGATERCARAATRSSCASTPRTRWTSFRAPAASSSIASREGRACASTPAWPRAASWASSSTRCSPSSIVRGPDRDAAIGRARRALSEWVVLGVETNMPLLAAVLDSPEFASGQVRHGSRRAAAARRRRARAARKPRGSRRPWPPPGRSPRRPARRPRSPRSPDPVGRPPGLEGRGVKSVRLRHRGETREVRLDEESRRAGRSPRIVTAVAGDQIFVWCDGATYCVRSACARRARRRGRRARRRPARARCRAGSARSARPRAIGSSGGWS